MATVTLTTDKTAYTVGEVITATYTVTGADARTVTLSGALTLDGQAVNIPPTQVTIGSTIVYSPPTGEGLTFAPTGVAGVYTATV